jgi:hypothetical protein
MDSADNSSLDQAPSHLIAGTPSLELFPPAPEKQQGAK